MRIALSYLIVLLGVGISAWAAPAIAAEESKPVAAADRPVRDDDAERALMTEMRATITALTSRLQAMEGQVDALNDKLSTTQSNLNALMATKKTPSTPVRSHPSDGVGLRPNVQSSLNDPEGGFSNDDAVQSYRKASFLLSAQKYSEAVLAFSSFLEKYPDHALAGSAQFFVGDSYFKQKEYKLALSEFERVLTSYDRSSHVSDTLREMSEAEDHLKMTDKAARHRQLLTSLFPQSPAASTPPAKQEEAAAPSHTAPTENSHPPGTALDAPPTAPLTHGGEAQ